MLTRSWWVGLVGVMLVAGCRAWSPGLPGAKEEAAWTLRFDPPATDGQVEPIVHIEVAGAARSVDLTDVWLFRGKVTSAQRRSLERDEPSKALLARRIEARVYAIDDDVVIAPESRLAAEIHTVAIPAKAWTAEVAVRPEARFPVLSRVWPPLDAPAQPSAWVFCGDALTGEPAEVELDPIGAPGTFSRWGRASCVKFAGASLDEGFVVPPSWIVCDGAPCALEPGGIEVAPTLARTPATCDAGEVAFGDGCAEVEDDRLTVRGPDAPLYWSISIDGEDSPLFEGAVPAAGRFLVRGLKPDSAVSLLVRTLDAWGAEHADPITFTTRAARAHVVLSEVYANPVGAEPAQEWVELFNDGVVPVELAGVVLRDAGGETLLPEATLAPGAFALLANDAMQVDDGFDVPVPPECAVVRVPSLGKNGLGNGGEPLALVGPDGTTWSRFPPLGASKAGESAARKTPDALDDDADAFAMTAVVTPCAPNAF